ncbi:MAG TPA: HDIG domain-containing protein [Pirellulaceae bacterium]|nr:HDIG domain-containing protein [Pirellulaceae bacterium]
MKRELGASKTASWLAGLRRRDTWRSLGLWGVCCALVFVLTEGWEPTFSYRVNYVPEREISARVPFTIVAVAATEQTRQQARSRIVPYYAHDARQLREMRQALLDRVFLITRTPVFYEMDKEVWDSFLIPRPDESFEDDDVQNLKPVREVAGPAGSGTVADRRTWTDPEKRDAFHQFRDALKEDRDLAHFQAAVKAALQTYEENGLLEALEHPLSEGSQTQIQIHPPGDEEAARRIAVSDVRIAEVTDRLKAELASEFVERLKIDEERSGQLAERVMTWMTDRLPTTLKFNRPATKRLSDETASKIQPILLEYRAGDPLYGIEAGEPLDEIDLALLRQEHQAYLDQIPWTQTLAHAVGHFGMYIALSLLCGVYFAYHEPRLLGWTRSYLATLGTISVAIVLAYFFADRWRLELAPMMILAMSLSIAFRFELALLVSAAVALVTALTLRQGLFEFVVLMATMSTAALFCGRVRSRTKLVYVSFFAAATAFLTTLGVGTLSGQPVVWTLLVEASAFALVAVLSGLLMTALLPFAEKLFDIQTDISLLEMSDMTHPLLQQLVRRAPGTYNHSINVASLAEAAAESIGANGLLVRVGAYFHDIGKMLKPEYFVENQKAGENRHGSLQPTMSTLVIIAHVKEGAELARRHGLPHTIIDFIEQHHGTTLVEYFYREAQNREAQKGERAVDRQEIEEASFRYPGPKPQTRESAILMIADSVESASRVLVEPTPSRIEHLVESLVAKKLQDGQFDECGMSFRELNVVQETLVKSLSAMYHSRIKYPPAASA